MRFPNYPSAACNWWTSDDPLDGPVLQVLDDLQRAGKIRYTGLGGTTAYAMARLIRAHRFDVLLTAFNYSLLWREAQSISSQQRGSSTWGSSSVRRCSRARSRPGASLK